MTVDLFLRAGGLLEPKYTATEDALYDSNAIRKFVGLNSDERAPDATTLLKFRHLLEENDLCEKLFQSIKKMLDDKGCIIDLSTNLAILA